MSNKIIFQFENEKDLKEVLTALDRKTEITWNSETKIAMMKVIKGERTVLISKSVYNVPKPLRL